MQFSHLGTVQMFSLNYQLSDDYLRNLNNASRIVSEVKPNAKKKKLNTILRLLLQLARHCILPISISPKECRDCRN